MGDTECEPVLRGDLTLDRVTLVYDSGEAETFHKVAAQVITGHQRHSYIVVVLPVERIEDGTAGDVRTVPPG